MKLISVQRLYNHDKKKYVAKFETDKGYKFVYFGDKNYTDYLTHGDSKRRDAYRARHASGKNAIYYSPNALSYHISWGNTQSLHQNIIDFKKKYGI